MSSNKHHIKLSPRLHFRGSKLKGNVSAKIKGQGLINEKRTKGDISVGYKSTETLRLKKNQQEFINSINQGRNGTHDLTKTTKELRCELQKTHVLRSLRRQYQVNVKR